MVTFRSCFGPCWTHVMKPVSCQRDLILSTYFFVIRVGSGICHVVQIVFKYNLAITIYYIRISVFCFLLSTSQYSKAFFNPLATRRSSGLASVAGGSKSREVEGSRSRKGEDTARYLGCNCRKDSNFMEGEDQQACFWREDNQLCFLANDFHPWIWGEISLRDKMG